MRSILCSPLLFRLMRCRRLHETASFYCGWYQSKSLGAGTASKGLYRVHQFSKVEMFVVSTEAQSEDLLSEICQIEEEIFTELGLHYHVLVRSCLPPLTCTLQISQASAQSEPVGDQQEGQEVR